MSLQGRDEGFPLSTSHHELHCSLPVQCKNNKVEMVLHCPFSTVNCIVVFLCSAKTTNKVEMVLHCPFSTINCIVIFLCSAKTTNKVQTKVSHSPLSMSHEHCIYSNTKCFFSTIINHCVNHNSQKCFRA